MKASQEDDLWPMLKTYSECLHSQDLIIDAIYADIIHGKLDQKNKQVRTVKSDQYLVSPKSIASVLLSGQTWFEK